MIPVQPTFMPQPFANSGEKNVIPNSGGEVLGNASFASGFPRVTETPIELGGVPPQRKDFNGILNALSMFAFFAQSGGVYEYSATSNYDTPAVVIYNNVFYFCLQQNGVDSVNGVKAPTDTAYWIPLIDYLLEGLSVGTPIGTIIMWAGSNDPIDGGVWLDCNGQSCSDYPALVSVLGSSTVPDMRGLFPRCIGSQTFTVGTYGNTTYDGGSVVGRKQADAIRNLSGSFICRKDSVGNHLVDVESSATNVFTDEDGPVTNRTNGALSSDLSSTRIRFNASNAVPTDVENRPANISLRFLIKAQ